MPHPSSCTRRPTRVGPLILFGLLLGTGGCNLVGAVAGKVVGQPPVPARYVPDATAPLLVIAEDFRNPSMARGDSDRLRVVISGLLAEEKVAPIVEPSRLAMIRDADPLYAKKSVVDVAKAAGARQVLYVDLRSLAVGAQPGSDMLKGIGVASVKLIDVESARAVFPGESEGLTVNFATPIRRAGDRSTPDTVRNETIVGLARTIARLFHKWQPEDNDPQSESGI